MSRAFSRKKPKSPRPAASATLAAFADGTELEIEAEREKENLMKLKIALTAFAVACFPALSSAATFVPHAERLFGYYAHPRGIAFQVYSGGCTDKQSFRLQREGGENAAVTLVRIQEDPCLALLFRGTFVNFTYEELGIRPGRAFAIKNAFRDFPGSDE